MYLLSYFRTEAEALHLALSRDGLKWCALNQNRPVWQSPIGARSVRDPFLLRERNGLFHLLSTNSWGEVNILHAVSEDAIHWRSAELLPVMEGVEGARNAWAPEAVWDEEEARWQLFWSSSLQEADVEIIDADWNHRIWGCHTRDWKTFSPAQIFFDPGHSVIDATIVRDGGRYLMAYKDERGRNDENNPFKRIKTCTASRLNGPWEAHSEFLTPVLSEGPTLFKRHDAEWGKGWTLFYDLFAGARFGALHSSDSMTWHDITARVEFPLGPRHASILPLDAITFDALLRYV